MISITNKKINNDVDNFARNVDLLKHNDKYNIEHIVLECEI